MTHDYAKRKKPPAKKSKARKSQVPAWVWLFTGVVTGVFISFLMYLADLTPERVSGADDTASAKTSSKKPHSTHSTTKFDFYTLLPEREVIVPDEPDAGAGAEPEEEYVYMLQAGSFKSASDADRLRARLILKGMDVKVEAVTVNGGDQWHRVQVGPFHDRSALSKARNDLISEGIDTLLMKRKAG